MSGTLGKVATDSKQIIRTIDALTERTVGNVIVDIVLLLFPPPNSAAQLAVLLDCSVRWAEKLLSGNSKWSGDDIAAIVAEIMCRHRMRNVKVVKRG